MKKENIQVIKEICGILESLIPENKISLSAGGDGFESLIEYVNDRPGHDLRYAIDASRLKKNLGGNRRRHSKLVLEKQFSGF